jgi:UDP-N-acetylglucosamine 2-epimerase (non-hydrolysing)
MNRARLIMTDSGGIQEEAPSIGKPVVVLRDRTERVEALDAGTAILVGTDPERIQTAVEALMSDEQLYDSIAARENPYGDGRASQRILDVLFSQLCADAELVAAR